MRKCGDSAVHSIGSLANLDSRSSLIKASCFTIISQQGDTPTIDTLTISRIHMTTYTLVHSKVKLYNLVYIRPFTWVIVFFWQCRNETNPFFFPFFVKTVYAASPLSVVSVGTRQRGQTMDNKWRRCISTTVENGVGPHRHSKLVWTAASIDFTGTHTYKAIHNRACFVLVYSPFWKYVYKAYCCTISLWSSVPFHCPVICQKPLIELLKTDLYGPMVPAVDVKRKLNLVT